MFSLPFYFIQKLFNTSPLPRKLKNPSKWMQNWFAGDGSCNTSICQNLVPQISRFDMMELNAECTFLGLSDISYFKISHVIVPLILSHHFCSREHLSSKSSSHPSHQASSSFGIFYTYTPHNIYGKFICC